jgi:hypothetical protein
MKYPAGTRVRVAWRPAREGEEKHGRQQSWWRVPLSEGIECEIEHGYSDDYVYVRPLGEVTFHDGDRACSFTPGEWKQEGEMWEVIHVDETAEREFFEKLRAQGLLYHEASAPDLAKIIHDYHGSGDFHWTDIEVGVLVKELLAIAEAEGRDGVIDAVDSMIERAGL